MSRRINKINELLKQQIGEAILRNLDLKQGTLITITNVRVSTDFKLAKVRISIMPFLNSEKILKILKNKRGIIQKVVNQKLEMKKIPKIKFELDKAEQRTEKVEQLIKQMHKND